MTVSKPTHFHPGEITLQNKLGLAERIAQATQSFIRPYMPDQHRELFAELPMGLLGVVDYSGVPWAVPVFGLPGFMQSPRPSLLSIDVLPDTLDLLSLDLSIMQKVGFLGIQLDTRRRNRMNGIITHISEGSLDIEVDQSFGNCPKYIQARQLHWSLDSHQLNRTKLLQEAVFSSSLDSQSQALIAQADTFFIASRTAEFTAQASSGVDVSHRGGKPGFIKVCKRQLVFPDFSGNRFFNTLGNIQSDPRVGLFIPDFISGDSVFLSGQAEVIWDGDEVNAYPGAERLVVIKVEKSVFIPSYSPLTSQTVELSPTLNATGSWG